MRSPTPTTNINNRIDIVTGEISKHRKLLAAVDESENNRPHRAPYSSIERTMVGLSIPQLRRYDRTELLEPEGRSEAGYRRYSDGQTGVGRVISLLRSIDVPIADVRRVLAGITEHERQQLFAEHRLRLEARLDQEALGLRLVWQTGDGSLSAIASGAIEVLYVEDPDVLCAEYQAAGGAVIEPVATRPSGMRDFVAADPDGHRFTVGCGTEALRDVADHYGLDAQRSLSIHTGSEPDTDRDAPPPTPATTGPTSADAVFTEHSAWAVRRHVPATSDRIIGRAICAARHGPPLRAHTGARCRLAVF